MHFLVYGAGALGQALGCLLAAAGHEVVLVLRQRYIEAMRAGGLRVTGIFGEYRTAPGQLALWPDLQGRNGERFDYVLLTTKTYDTAAALAEIAALAGCHCPVVSLQNGCGNLEQLISVVGAVRSLAARVITGFEIEAPGTVRITVSADRVHIGGSERGVIPPAAANLAAVLDRAGLPSLAVADVHQSLFAKLLYNCALNPLGAVLGVHYGALAESASARGIMAADTAIAETFVVIRPLAGRCPGVSPNPTAASVLRLTRCPQRSPPSAVHAAGHRTGQAHRGDAMVGYVAARGGAPRRRHPQGRLLAELVRARE